MQPPVRQQRGWIFLAAVSEILQASPARFAHIVVTTRLTLAGIYAVVPQEAHGSSCCQANTGGRLRPNDEVSFPTGRI